jgi:hypothetical protein
MTRNDAGPATSKRAAIFVERWVASHILGTEQDVHTRHCAQSCLVDAERSGIRRREIESAVGDLEAYLAKAIKRASPLGPINQLVSTAR